MFELKSIKKLSDWKSLLVLSIPLLVSACGGLPPTVSESDRDRSGAYDGVWTVSSIKTASPQFFGDWQSTCRKPTLNFEMEIKDGVLQIKSSNDTQQTYVGSNGRFRLTVPINARASASASSEVGLNSGIKLFLSGELAASPAKGKYVAGIAEFAYRGCTSYLEYTKK